jgi:hypothetical protein
MEDERENHAPDSIEPKDRRKAEEEELNVHVTYEIIRRAGEEELAESSDERRPRRSRQMM